MPGLILFLLVVWVLKNAAMDVMHAANGTENPRYAARKRAKEAAGGRYGFRDYWDDLWSDVLAERTRLRREKDRRKHGRDPELDGGQGTDEQSGGRRAPDPDDGTGNDGSQENPDPEPQDATKPGDQPRHGEDPNPGPAGNTVADPDPHRPEPASTGPGNDDTACDDPDYDGHKAAKVLEFRRPAGDKPMPDPQRPTAEQWLMRASLALPACHQLTLVGDSLAVHGDIATAVGECGCGNRWRVRVRCLGFDVLAPRLEVEDVTQIRWADVDGPPTVPYRGSAAGNHSNHPAPRNEKGTTMTDNTEPNAEVIGLDQSIAYTTQLRDVAANHGLAGNEGYIGQLERGGNSGAVVTTAAEMQEAFDTAAAKAEAHLATLLDQKAIQEQYDVQPDAGGKEYVTAGR